jgi:fructose-1,6-bisphosphatase/inositol monophosphatase family enzyme
MQDTLISAHVDEPGFYFNGEFEISPRQADIPVFTLGESQDWDRNSIRQTEDILFAAGLTLVKHRCCVVGMAYAAMGLTRGYFEKNTNIWDVSAGYVIAEQSGLEVDIKRNESNQQLRISVLQPAVYDAVSVELEL